MTPPPKKKQRPTQNRACYHGYSLEMLCPWQLSSVETKWLCQVKGQRIKPESVWDSIIDAGATFNPQRTFGSSQGVQNTKYTQYYTVRIIRSVHVVVNRINAAFKSYLMCRKYEYLTVSLTKIKNCSLEVSSPFYRDYYSGTFICLFLPDLNAASWSSWLQKHLIVLTTR